MYYAFARQNNKSLFLKKLLKEKEKMEKCYKCGADTDNKISYTTGVIANHYNSEYAICERTTHENIKRFNGNQTEINICHECMVKLDRETKMYVLSENAKYEKVEEMKKEKTMIAEDAFEFDIELSLLKGKDFTENLDTGTLKKDYKVEVDINADFSTIDGLKNLFRDDIIKIELNKLYGKYLFKDESKPLEKTLELIDALGKNSKYEKALDKLQNQFDELGKTYDALAKDYGDLLTELKGYKELEVKFNELGETYDTLAKDYEDLAKENNKLKDELKKKPAVIYKASSEIYEENTNLLIQVNSLKKNHKELHNKYTDLQALDERKNERIRNQRYALGRYQNRIIELNEQVKILNHELDQAKGMLNLRKDCIIMGGFTPINFVERELKGLDNECKLKKENKELNEQLEKVKKSHRNFQVMLNRLLNMKAEECMHTTEDLSSSLYSGVLNVYIKNNNEEENK